MLPRFLRTRATAGKEIENETAAQSTAPCEPRSRWPRVVCVSSSMLAQRKPRLVAGCPSTPAAFHSCAVEAKAFTPPRTPDGQPNLQGSL